MCWLRRMRPGIIETQVKMLLGESALWDESIEHDEAIDIDGLSIACAAARAGFA